MTSKAQRLTILALETTPGDGATPDVAIRAKTNFRAKPEKIVPDEDIGSFAPARHYIGSLMAEGGLEMDGYYEHAPYPVSMALGQGVRTGAADPWTYTFTLPDATAPTFATYRVEYTDGDDHIVSANDVFATELEISGEAAGAWVFKPKLTGGNVTFPAALGASLTPLATPTAIRMADTTLEMRDTFAGLIDTPNVPVLISFNWKLEGLQHPKQFAGSLYPSGRGNDKWKITLEMVVEISDAVIEAQKDKLLNTSQTAIRIKAAASANDSALLDGMFVLSEVDTLDDRSGNNILKLTYLAEKGSLGNLPRVVITTNLSSL